MHKLLLLSMCFLLLACSERSGTDHNSGNSLEGILEPYGTYLSDEPYNFKLVLDTKRRYQFCRLSECFEGEIEHVNEIVVRLLGFYDHALALEFERQAFPETFEVYVADRKENPDEWNFWYFSPFICGDDVCAGFGSKMDRIVFRKHS